MKSILLLVASLALNVVLLGAVLRSRGASFGGEQSPIVPETSDRIAASRSDVAAPRSDPGPSSTADGSLPFHWSQLDTADWFAYRDGLLRVGCPASTVRNILKPLVTRHYSTLCQERLRPFVDEFWDRFRPPTVKARREMEADLERIDGEEGDLLARLFGALPAETPGALPLEPGLRRQLDFIAEDLHPEVTKRLETHHTRLRKTAYSKFPSAVDQSKAYQGLQEQLKTELAEILSPDQIDKLMLRRSPLARFREIEGHDLNEADLWEVIRRAESLASPEEARHEDYIPPQRVREAMEAVLGTERAAAVLRAEQPEFQKLLEVTQRLEVPDERVEDLWKAQETLADAVRRLIQDSTLSHAERRARVQQLRESLGMEVEGMLGGARARETWEHALQPFLDLKTAIPDFDPVSALESP